MVKIIKDKKFIISVIFSLLALIISFFSLCISYQSKNISKYSLLINYQPILQAIFETDVYGDSCTLILKNDGPNDIFDVHIKKYTKIWNDSNQTICSEIKTKDDLLFSKKMTLGEIKRLPINYFNIQNAYNFGTNFNKEYYIPFLQFVITFRRYPDKTIFEVRKYLFIATNKKNNKPMIIDPDSEFTISLFKQIKKTIELYELEN